MTDVSPETKAHPDYHDGYFAGMQDQFHRGESPEYEAGYKAGCWAREMFVRNGFTPTRDGFSARFSTKTEPRREITKQSRSGK